MLTEAVSGKKQLQIQKYPDTCGRGLKYLDNTSWKVREYGIYARVVDVPEIERVISAANELESEISNTKTNEYEALSMLYCVYYILTSFWRPFHFKYFQNTENCRYTHTRREMTTKWKY